MKVTELTPVYDRAQSYYRKAFVIQLDDDTYTLQSYDTMVCEFNKRTQEFTRLWSDWSATTGRHINDFYKQMRGNSASKHMNKKRWASLEPLIRYNCNDIEQK